MTWLIPNLRAQSWQLPMLTRKSLNEYRTVIQNHSVYGYTDYCKQCYLLRCSHEALLLSPQAHNAWVVANPDASYKQPCHAVLNLFPRDKVTTEQLSPPPLPPPPTTPRETNIYHWTIIVPPPPPHKVTTEQLLSPPPPPTPRHPAPRDKQLSLNNYCPLPFPPPPRETNRCQWTIIAHPSSPTLPTPRDSHHWTIIAPPPPTPIIVFWLTVLWVSKYIICVIAYCDVVNVQPRFNFSDDIIK